MSSPTVAEPKKTPLYERHKRLGARVIDFGGWAMPVQYTGILDEHRAVRERAGLFDVSHMGEVSLFGPRAAEMVQRLVTNDVSKLRDRTAMYTVACRPDGGIVDDLIVYRKGPEHYLIVVNASNIDKDVAWFKEQTRAISPNLDDESERTALLAVQGPRAVGVVAGLADGPIAELKSFAMTKATVAGVAAWVARTGYTGEDGVEIFCAPEDAARLWDALLEAGRPVGLQPIGLGARDTLRLEARLCLYGNDIDEEHTPHEAGLSWVVKGRGFVGEEALARQKAEGVRRRLVGLVLRERGIARHGYPILDDSGAPIGVVTSGTTGPTVGASIAMGYVPAERAEPGQHLIVDCRGKPARAEIVKGPFYKRPS